MNTPIQVSQALFPVVTFSTRYEIPANRLTKISLTFNHTPNNPPLSFRSRIQA